MTLRRIEAQLSGLLTGDEDYGVVAYAPQQPAVYAVALLYPSSLRLLWSS